MHGTLLDNFCEKLHPRDQEPEGRLFGFFSKNENIATGRYKWLAALKKEYKTFWKTILNETSLENIDKTILVMKSIESRKIMPNKTCMISITDNYCGDVYCRFTSHLFKVY